ncbi:hypothetical protein SPBR_03284 [Sporothrix brasiliensis 5110]|uniref:Uncharacterized protein n=1 Tax=Sporothrix brasiliensis 5110 TaxID=1398154 RepID=A0A0C2J6N6_9PEZI|nr:uncharacterized protein SPBR_03284 [Sporothrix brasiliensis 5110]KIH92672.1 hypothetical protein SPBR_03284 [Sporothrix brasiliensis 5110]
MRIVQEVSIDEDAAFVDDCERAGNSTDRRHSTISYASASSHENNSDGQDGSGKSGHIKTATATSKTSLASAGTGRSLGGFGFRPYGERSTSKEQITTIDERRPSRATAAALQEHDE